MNTTPIRILSANDSSALSALWKINCSAGDGVLEVGDGQTIAIPAQCPEHAIVITNTKAHAQLSFWAASSVQQLTISLCLAEGSTLQAVLVTPKEHPGLQLQVQTRLQNQAHLSCVGVCLSDRSSLTVRSELLGNAATSDIETVLYARGHETQACDVRNVFIGPQGGGKITMRAVAEEQARINMNGLIEIAEQGNGTDTFLTQEVLMLDPTATIHTVPGLEIRTNDVKASHSATVSRITPEDLFYFQSRGITEPEARAMFVEGFLGTALDRIQDIDLRERTKEAILVKYQR